MKHLSLLVLSFFLFAQYGFSQKTSEKESILKVLSTQEQAWNTGDIDAFMLGYWHDDSLAFVGAKGVTYGWDNTLKRYQTSYPDTIAMGKLRFDIIKVDVLDKKSAFVIGKWRLTRTIGDIGGHFTLLFKKFGNHWLIVVDHTS
ncbi:MAG: nuclear transport factor 2 family protein [Chitinophagaceae bacterium]